MWADGGPVWVPQCPGAQHGTAQTDRRGPTGGSALGAYLLGQGAPPSPEASSALHVASAASMSTVRPAVSYCVGLMNRGAHFREAWASLLAMDAMDWELIVADFGSTDRPFEGLAADLRLRVFSAALPFTRAKALNRAAAFACGEIICFLDADIVVPPDFQQVILRWVEPGTAYWPICYRLHEHAPREVLGDRVQYSPGQHNGHWERAGYGLCAFHESDWRSLGWNEDFKAWGGEDNELFARAVVLGLRPVRRQVTGLFHLHHSRDLSYRERYHDYLGKAQP